MPSLWSENGRKEKQVIFPIFLQTGKCSSEFTAVLCTVYASFHQCHLHMHACHLFGRIEGARNILLRTGCCRPSHRTACPSRSGLAVGETVILLALPPHSYRNACWRERGVQQNESLAGSYAGRKRRIPRTSRAAAQPANRHRLVILERCLVQNDTGVTCTLRKPG